MTESNGIPVDALDVAVQALAGERDRLTAERDALKRQLAETDGRLIRVARALRETERAVGAVEPKQTKPKGTPKRHVSAARVADVERVLQEAAEADQPLASVQIWQALGGRVWGDRNGVDRALLKLRESGRARVAGYERIHSRGAESAVYVLAGEPS